VETVSLNADRTGGPAFVAAVYAVTVVVTNVEFFAGEYLAVNSIAACVV